MLETDIGYAVVRTTLSEDGSYRTEARVKGGESWFLPAGGPVMDAITAREKHTNAVLILEAELGGLPDGQDTP